MRSLRLVVLLVTLLALWPAAPGGAVPPIAESEPNNASTEADVLAGGECFVVGSGAISPVTDADYWSFQATAGATAWAYVDTGGTPSGTSTDSRLTLFAPDGTSIEEDNDDGIGNGGDGTVESGLSSAIGGAALSSGTHSLSVTENGNDAVIDPYRLFLAVPTASPSPESEPNDAFGQANPITGCPEVRSGTISSGTDQDWFAVTAAAGETLFIVAADTPNLRVSLRPPPEGAAPILSGPITAFPAPPATAFSYNISTAGTYFVRVQFGLSGETGPYRLMVATCDLAAATCPGTDQPPPTGQTQCAGRTATHLGTPGDDVLVGTGADETFLGLGGNDRITGGGGNDTICAGPGKDTVRGKSGKDRIFGEGGGDVLKGGGGKDTVKGGPGKDRLAGQGGNDTLRGQGGSDRLNGGPGIDRCAQGAGKGPEISCER
jgi:Ca2+-binding RTX toxin-like protein